MPDVHFSNQYPYTDFHELNLDWVIDTVKHWSELVGKTIQSITLTGTTGLVDTYTINYSDGTTSTFSVTNGRGIVSIVMTSVAGLVATYTVTYNDGTTSTFDVTDGRGIISIEKTATVGLTDTYTITYNDGTESTFEVENGAESLDATLTLAGYAADAKAVGDALDEKQDKDQPIALANNLTPYSPDSGVTQAIPFINQGTGCGNGESVVDTGSYCQLKKKLGNTVGVNQLVPDAHSIAAGTYNWNGIFGTSISGKELIKDHYYLTFVDTSELVIRWRNESLGVIGTNGRYVVYKPTTTDNHYYVQASGTLTSTAHLKWIDLSLWFGSNDAIPAHLLSHPEDFGRYYSGSLAYDAGHLESADGSVLTSIGRNVWDEEWELGAYDLATGGKKAASNTIRNKNAIECSPNTSYYIGVWIASILFYDAFGNYISYAYASASHVIVTPNRCSKMCFIAKSSYGTTYKNDITISLYYPGESGYDQYYPYSVLAEVDTGSEVLRSAGAVADEKTPDGTIIRRVGVADLGGPLAWNYDNGVFYSTSLASLAKPQQFPRCARYLASDGGEDKTIYIGTGGIIYVYDSYYTNVPDFIDGMDSVYMYYELLTPTTEQGTSFPAVINIDDFGSMIWTQTNGVPQGVEIFYPVDYKAFVDSMYNIVSGDAADFATDAELAIVSGRVPTAPAGDGTYVLKATVSGGVPTYSWVAE